MPLIFAGSVGLLLYSHYLTWLLRRGGPRSRVILCANTLLIAFLWRDRVALWLQ